MWPISVSMEVDYKYGEIHWPTQTYWFPDKSSLGYFEFRWGEEDSPTTINHLFSWYLPICYVSPDEAYAYIEKQEQKIQITNNNFSLPITSIFHGGILKATIPNFKTKSGFETELTTYVQVPSYQALTKGVELYGPINLGYDSSGTLKAWEDVPFTNNKTPSTTISPHIEGETFIKPNIEYTYKYIGEETEEGEWSINPSSGIKISNQQDKEITIKWIPDEYIPAALQFVLSYSYGTEESKTKESKIIICNTQFQAITIKDLEYNIKNEVFDIQ